MKIDRPLISVVIPVFNGEKWIIETIESVQQQTYSNIEIIIIDDGSIDNTNLVIKKLQKKHSNIQYFYQENSGPASARNNGIRQSNGKYIAFLDSDDVWLPHKLTTQLEFMDANNCHLSITNMSVVDEKLNKLYNQKKILPEGKKAIIAAFFENKIAMNTPTILVEKDVLLEKNIFFDEELRNREDHFFLMNFADKSKICLLDECLALRRVRNDSLSQMNLVEDIINKNLLFLDKALIKFPYLNFNKEMSRLLLGQATYYLKNNTTKNRLSILKKVIQSIKLNPYHIKAYSVFIITISFIDFNKIKKLAYRF